jgi:hypothetical protein
MRSRKLRPGLLARRLPFGLLGVAAALAGCVLPAAALGASDTIQFTVNSGQLSFPTPPDVPDFDPLTLAGQAQTQTAQMPSFAVEDASGSGAGWSVTVVGDSSAGKSAVFKEFNPSSSSYVGGGATLDPNSVTLDSSSAGTSPLNGSTGAGPTHSCDSGCFVDAPSPVKVASAAPGSAGIGTYELNGYTASSLALTVPTSVTALGAGEAYHVDLLWSLNSGP